MKAKRLYVEVRWSPERLWHVVNRDTGRVIRTFGVKLQYFSRKEEGAIEVARQYCKAHAPAELVVYNKNGRIAKGTHGRSTFGADPEKTRG